MAEMTKAQVQQQLQRLKERVEYLESRVTQHGLQLVGTRCPANLRLAGSSGARQCDLHAGHSTDHQVPGEFGYPHKWSAS